MSPDDGERAATREREPDLAARYEGHRLLCGTTAGAALLHLMASNT
jgi:hypothetical protein